MEGAEFFSLLESNQPQIVEDIKMKCHELLNSSDTWLVNGLFDYSMQTGSLRTVDVLIGIREPHETHLFNKFSESLRGNNKLQALTLLGHIVRRQPTWLFKITRHSLFKDLLKLLKTETEIVPLMSALLVINVLLPTVAGLMESCLQELFTVFSHLAKFDTINPNKLSECQLFHLQMGLYALFLRLYGMYPCNFLSYLRIEYSQSTKLLIFNHTIRPMLDTVKVHPMLVTASKDVEVSSSRSGIGNEQFGCRWRKMEAHDVIVECAKLSFNGGDYEKRADDGSSRVSLDHCLMLDNRYVTRSASGGDREFMSPVSYSGISTPTQSSAPESAPTSIPHTPIAQTHMVGSTFPLQDGASPPEAAVEATPETTPIKDLRNVVRAGHHPNSSIPRALNAISNSPNHSQPSSPMRKEASPFRFTMESSAFQPAQERKDSLITQKVQRLVTDRVQTSTENIDKTKSRGPMQPTSPLRVISGQGLSYGTESPAELPIDQEDREVEITMTSDTNSHVWNPRQCDSVVQDIASNDHEDLEECQQDLCTASGICMPNSNSMWDFTRKVNNRLRFYSQCHAEPPHQGLSTGSSPNDGFSIPINPKVRRANSCPEMKKTCSSLERHPVEKVDEEPSPVNGVTVDFPATSSNGKETASIGTQTDNPLPYEHLFLAVFPTADSNNSHQLASEEVSGVDTNNSSPLPQKTFSPTQIDTYMNATVNTFFESKKTKSQGMETELKATREQLQLMNIQLYFEKHRREMHAERNRRLLGRCRKVRSQEELTTALKEQVALLQADNELLHNSLHKRSEEAKVYVQQLQETLKSYQNQKSSLQLECTKERSLRESIEEVLKQEREKTANVTKELNETKASLFNATNELHHVASVVSENRVLRESMSRLQKELVAEGEVQERYRQRVNSLLRHLQNSSEVELLENSYVHQISSLNQELRNQNDALSAATFRISELDTLLTKRDATNNESKRLMEEAKDEFHEQLAVVQAKYDSLKAVNSRLETEILKLQTQLGAVQVEQPVEAAIAYTPPNLPPVPPETFSNLQTLVDVPDPSDHNP
uniref:Hamartin n=1 Tax=Homalodisca liturata TaxID=320908 RepID=A0A1B6J1T1_9HEMI